MLHLIHLADLTPQMESALTRFNQVSASGAAQCIAIVLTRNGTCPLEPGVVAANERPSTSGAACCREKHTQGSHSTFPIAPPACFLSYRASWLCRRRIGAVGWWGTLPCHPLAGWSVSVGNAGRVYCCLCVWAETQACSGIRCKSDLTQHTCLCVCFWTLHVTLRCQMHLVLEPGLLKRSTPFTPPARSCLVQLMRAFLAHDFCCFGQIMSSALGCTHSQVRSCCDLCSVMGIHSSPARHVILALHILTTHGV